MVFTKSMPVCFLFHISWSYSLNKIHLTITYNDKNVLLGDTVYQSSRGESMAVGLTSKSTPAADFLLNHKRFSENIHFHFASAISHHQVCFCAWSFFMNIGLNILLVGSFMSSVVSTRGMGNSRLSNRLYLRCLCGGLTTWRLWSTFWKSGFKQQLAC